MPKSRLDEYGLEIDVSGKTMEEVYNLVSSSLTAEDRSKVVVDTLLHSYVYRLNGKRLMFLRRKNGKFFFKKLATDKTLILRSRELQELIKTKQLKALKKA